MRGEGAHLGTIRFWSGGSSTQKGVRQTVIGILVLILKQYESGGMIFRHEKLEMV